MGSHQQQQSDLARNIQPTSDTVQVTSQTVTLHAAKIHQACDKAQYMLFKCTLVILYLCLYFILFAGLLSSVPDWTSSDGLVQRNDGMLVWPPMHSPKINSAVRLHDLVSRSGEYNYVGIRIPLNTTFDIPLWRELLANFADKNMIDYLEFGWPTGYSADTLPDSTFRNHPSALRYASACKEYISSEVGFGALVGPLKFNPFSAKWVISPLLSVAKDETKRRTVVDLSYPSGKSVNSGILKDIYLGETINLVLPSVDDFAALIMAKGPGSLMYKRDLSRAYRQIPVDPQDYNLLCIQWDGNVFFDTVLPFGLRSAAMMCQRVTSGVAFICLEHDFHVLNYLDDFAGVEVSDRANQAFEFLGSILASLGLGESEAKAVAPTTSIEFLGIRFDTMSMTMEVTPRRLSQTISEVSCWLNKERAKLRELQSLIGKLSFVSKCSKPARVFMNRLLNMVRDVENKNIWFTLSSEMKKDLQWWAHLLPQYNGISLLDKGVWSNPDEVLSSDACPSGCGGVIGKEAYRASFPLFIVKENLHINALEILAVMVALKLWKEKVTGKLVTIFCDNSATVAVINTGRSRDVFMQACVREIVYFQTIYDFQLRAVHLAGSCNRMADALSRYELDRKYREVVKSANFENVVVAPVNCFKFLHKW